MAAGVAADRPGHSRIAWFASDRVIATLAISSSNRMNRWEINDVEPHSLCIVYARQAIAESRSSIAVALCGAREEFIPCTEQCRRAVDYDTGSRLILGGVGPVGVGRHQHFQ